MALTKVSNGILTPNISVNSLQAVNTIQAPTLKTNTIQDTAGINQETVLQIVTATSFADFAITATSETVYLNPLITITPKKSNSLIVFSMTFNAYHGVNDYYTSIWLRRNSIGTAISSHPNDNTWGDWTTNWASMNSVGAHAQQNMATAWDYPGTTNAVNYLLTGKNYQSGKSFQFWGSSGGIKIIAMEIQQ